MGPLVEAAVVVHLILLIKMSTYYNAHILEHIKYLFLLLNCILYISKIKEDFIYIADELF